MALIPRKEYDELCAMLQVCRSYGFSHTMAVTKGCYYLDVHKMTPAELVQTAERAVPSIFLTNNYITAPGAQRVPFGPDRLYNLAVEELSRRYRSFGREWMRAESAQADPPEEDV